MYTKKKFFKIVSCKNICLSTLVLVFILISSAQGKIFKIENIEISEPFDNNFNKEKVISKAFSVAFKELTSSVITTKDKPKINYTNLNTVLLINPKNEEALYNLILLRVEQSNISESENLLKNFEKICDKLCTKLSELKIKIKQI